MLQNFLPLIFNNLVKNLFNPINKINYYRNTDKR